MLSVKSWKADAILRLILSVLVCISAGSLLTSAGRYFLGDAKVSRWFVPLLVPALGFLGATLVLLRQPWRLETMMRHLLRLLCCFYAGLVLGACAQKIAGPASPSVMQMIVGGLSFQGAAVLLVHLFLREHQTGWREGFGLDRDWTRAVLLGGIVGSLFLPVSRGLQWLSAEVMLHLPRMHLVPEQQQAVQTLHQAATWPDRLALGIVTMLLAPLAEEVLFRGVLYPGIKFAGFPRLAWWGTVLLFGLIHVNLATFLPLVVFAVVLTLLYERADNLLAPITAHAVFNALNFTGLYLSQK